MRSSIGRPGGAGRRVRAVERCSSVKDRRGDAVGGLDLLEFEFVAPGDQRPPDQLVGGHDDENQHGEAPEQGVHVDRIGEAAVCR